MHQITSLIQWLCTYFQFEINHSTRKALIVTSNVFGSLNNKFSSLSLHASKSGKSSYDIEMSSLPVRECGVIVSNPNNRDSKSTLNTTLDW